MHAAVFVVVGRRGYSATHVGSLGFDGGHRSGILHDLRTRAPVWHGAPGTTAAVRNVAASDRRHRSKHPSCREGLTACLYARSKPPNVDTPVGVGPGLCQLRRTPLLGTS